MFGTLDGDCSIVSAPWFSRYFVGSNDPWQALAQRLFNFDNCRWTDRAVAVTAFSGLHATFGLENLFFDLIQYSRDGSVHVGRNFGAMVEIMPRFDVCF